MGFDKYYSALLRDRTRTEPRADEALRDYQAMLVRVQVAAIF